MCGCGRTGHIEAYCGTAGIKRRVTEYLKQDRQSSPGKLLQEQNDFTPHDIYEAAMSGDQVALDTIPETARLLGTSIPSILHTIDPSIVLIGGAMTFGGAGDRIGELFINRIRAEVKSRILAVLADKFQIEFATLGGPAGYIGGWTRQSRTSEQAIKVFATLLDYDQLSKSRLKAGLPRFSATSALCIAAPPLSATPYF